MSHVLRSLSVGARQWAPASSRTSSISILYRLPSASRCNQAQVLQHRRSFWSKLFGRKKAVKDVSPEEAKFIYPESLCLYSAGRRTVWVGCMKLVSCYPFLMTVFYLGPNIEQKWPSLFTFPFATQHPELMAVSVAAITALPMGMFYLAAPYITHMYVKIPPYARVSRTAAMAWVKTVTPETRLRIFTMRWLGRPKLVEVPLGELRFCKKRLGCVNMEWRYTQKEKPRVTDFYIERKIGAGKVGHDAFYEIMSMIEQHTAGKIGRELRARSIPAGSATPVVTVAREGKRKVTPKRKS
ncbi:hypothetical protein H072_2130 [Dactylellina haptotyla CBS 200.50]|uniref:Uncharacterized protein n=1 Tax=Dactylellina haptotyla (strain CBS 200.50) TaxID=1284197 RepID=S8ALV8_DACHA|nr:hypothetical protein H072_2130 [Dactylellina haptotyla CBS 200.50]